MGKINFEELKKAKGFSIDYVEIKNIVDKNFVKELRRKNNYTQIRLAILLGVSKKAIEKWEQGTNPINGSSARLMYLLDLHPELVNDLLVEHQEETDRNCLFESTENFESATWSIETSKENRTTLLKNNKSTLLVG